MKRFLAIALLVTASAQAGGLHEFWMNLGGRNSQIASGLKAVVVGIGGLAAFDKVIQEVPKACEGIKPVWNSRFGWNETRSFAGHAVVAGSTLYALIVLWGHYLPTHIKDAAKGIN